jgi:hypothetical protein
MGRYRACDTDEMCHCVEKADASTYTADLVAEGGAKCPCLSSDV